MCGWGSHLLRLRELGTVGGGVVQVEVHLAEGRQLAQLNVLRQREHLHPLAPPGVGQHPAQLLDVALVWAQRETRSHLLDATDHYMAQCSPRWDNRSPGHNVKYQVTYLLDTTGSYMAQCLLRREIDHFYYSDTG